MPLVASTLRKDKGPASPTEADHRAPVVRTIARRQSRRREPTDTPPRGSPARWNARVTGLAPGALTPCSDPPGAKKEPGEHYTHRAPIG